MDSTTTYILIFLILVFLILFSRNLFILKILPSHVCCTNIYYILYVKIFWDKGRMWRFWHCGVAVVHLPPIFRPWVRLCIRISYIFHLIYVFCKICYKFCTVSISRISFIFSSKSFFQIFFCCLLNFLNYFFIFRSK